MPNELVGQVAIVTGAAHGFGRQICLELGRLGAKVAACDIVPEKLAETQALLMDRGATSIARTVDVTDELQVNAFVDDVASQWGRLDILVNNAGGTLGHCFHPVDQVPTLEWDRILKVNLYGPFFCTRAAARYMKPNRYGRIVNISSGAGRHYSRTGVQAYTSAKAGLIGFTRQCAFELGQFNINVNAIAPGLIMSTKEGMEAWELKSEEEKQATNATVALRRLGTAQDIADAVCYLVTKSGNWIAGQTIGVDGGHWMF